MESPESVDNEYEIYINDSKKISSEDWEKSMNYKFSMENIIGQNYDPGKDVVEKAENKIGVFIDDKNNRNSITIDQQMNPYPGFSMGFIDCFARVISESSYLSGTLALRYDPKNVGNVERSTLRLFEWNEKTNFFQIVEPSSVGKEGDYVWGRITSPGTYAAIGLDSDLSVRMLFKIIIDNTERLKSLKPEVQKGFFYSISEKLLGPDHELSKALKDKSIVSIF